MKKQTKVREYWAVEREDFTGLRWLGASCDSRAHARRERLRVLKDVPIPRARVVRVRVISQQGKGKVGR